jgi:hypothetical protein
MADISKFQIHSSRMIFLHVCLPIEWVFGTGRSTAPIGFQAATFNIYLYILGRTIRLGINFLYSPIEAHQIFTTYGVVNDNRE